MGQGVSCASSSYEHEFFSAVQAGDLAAVDCALSDDPSLLLRTTIYDRLSALHIAAANGRVQVRLLLRLSASSSARVFVFDPLWDRRFYLRFWIDLRVPMSLIEINR